MDPLAASFELAGRLQWIETLLLVATTVLLFALESVPRLRVRDYGRGRGPHLLRNAAVWLIGALAVTLLLGAFVVPAASWLEARRVGLFFSWPVPGWALALAGVALLDAAEYLFHRLSHEARWLWRLHALHHSDDRLDVSTNVRAHPGHVVLTLGWRLTVLAALGFPQWVAVLRDLIALPVALWSHANVRFPEGLDRRLRAVLVTPAMHRIHHSPDAAQTDSNYGGFFSFWDRAFGTYVRPEPGQPARYGLDTVDDPRAATLRGMLRLPWRLRPAPQAPER